MSKNNFGLIAKTKADLINQRHSQTEKLLHKNPQLFLFVTVTFNQKKETLPNSFKNH